MNMQNNTKVEDEVFQIASELVRKFSNKKTHECNFAMERAEFMNDDDFIYELPETPQFLESKNLADILFDDYAIVTPSFWIHHSMGRYSIYQPEINEKRELNFNSLRSRRINIRGFYSVAFKIEPIKDWYEKQLNKRVSANKLPFERKPDDWGWLNVNTGQYSFGKHGNFTQTGDIRGSVFKELMQLFEETPQVISIKALSKRTKINHDRLRIEIRAINQRLKERGLLFEGSGKGYYRIVSIDKK